MAAKTVEREGYCRAKGMRSRTCWALRHENFVGKVLEGEICSPLGVQFPMWGLERDGGSVVEQVVRCIEEYRGLASRAGIGVALNGGLHGLR